MAIALCVFERLAFASGLLVTSVHLCYLFVESFYSKLFVGNVTTCCHLFYGKEIDVFNDIHCALFPIIRDQIKTFDLVFRQ